MTTVIDNPRVYVGTYEKYNEGNLFGEWVDLTEFDSHADFIKFCHKLHKDEKDPEFMFQDFEHFPKEFYRESSISIELWDWLKLKEDEKNIINAFVKCFGTDFKTALKEFEDSFMGYYETFRDFVQEFFDKINEIPDHLIHYIDYEAVELDYEMDYTSYNGYVFARNW